MTIKFQDLNKVITKTAKSISDSEEFVTKILADKAIKASEIHPYDSTVVGMMNFLKKRAEKSLFITRKELSDVYQKLYSSNNKFASLFELELGIQKYSQNKVMNRDANEDKILDDKKIAHPILSNALSEIFNPSGSYKPYSVENAKLAEKICFKELNKFTSPIKVETITGQEDVLICQASYETPKGICNVIVPVEIQEGKVLFPSYFLKSEGFVEISKNNLENHIAETAGKKYSINYNNMLSAILNIKNGSASKLSELDIIIAKNKALEGDNFSSDNIISLTVDKKDDEPIKNAESDEFAKKLSNSTGIAEFNFGKQIVKICEKTIRQSLNNFGYSHPSIKIADVDENTIYFAVTVDNTAAFKIAMKVKDNKAEFPDFIIASGNVYDFSKKGIFELLHSQEVDTSMMAVASPVYGLKSSELIDIVKNAMVQNNLIKAEDALNVLQESGDEISFRKAFAFYQDGISNKLTTNESCCNKQRKVAYSKYLICGHTNLPVHKVYQDKNGDCQPSYRKDIPEAESGSFMHSKVYFG